MKKQIILTIILTIILLCTVNSQIISQAGKDNPGRFQDDNLGISFIKPGNVTQLDKSNFRIILSSNNSPAESAVARVSVSKRLFIDLPGSYGGKVYLDSAAASLLRNRVMIDSFNTGSQKFHREYWAVYAGMGMWDCVINCYNKRKGQYYIVSFVQDKRIGKPGEIFDGKPLTSEDLKLKAISSLKDTASAVIKQYNELISSFQIIK